MASTSSSSSSDKNASLIEQFCHVTGASKEKASEMLQVCSWNLEMAVNMHVDSCPDSENPYTDAVNGTDNVRPPIPQTRGVLVEDDINFHYGLRGTKRRPHAVFDGFRDFQAEARLHQSAHDTSESAKKRRTLEDLFRPPLDMMFRGNFESAREYGQISNRWLMVNLQSAQEFSCQVLNRDVWSNQIVKRLVAKNFVFWQVYLDSIDGQRFTQFYKAVTFPYIAVIDPRTGEKLVEWNEVDSKSIMELINNFLREHSSPDGSSVNSIAQNSTDDLVDQSEEAQIKAALEASLKDVKPTPIVVDDDSDLETFDSDSENTNDKISIVNINSNDDSNDTIDVVEITDINNSNTSSEETWKDFLGNDKDPESTLVLRLPDGEKEQISWPCSTKLKSLLLYVAEMGYNSEKYELVTNYPRRKLCQLDVLKSLKDIDLYPREMIFVQLKS